MTPLKLGTASTRIRSNMKILRAISISVNARNRCTAEVTRLTQNHNRCCGLASSRTADPLRHPTSSVHASSASMYRRCIGSSDSDIKSSRAPSPFKLMTRNIFRQAAMILVTTTATTISLDLAFRGGRTRNLVNFSPPRLKIRISAPRPQRGARLRLIGRASSR